MSFHSFDGQAGEFHADCELSLYCLGSDEQTQPRARHSSSCSRGEELAKPSSTLFRCLQVSPAVDMLSQLTGLDICLDIHLIQQHMTDHDWWNPQPIRWLESGQVTNVGVSDEVHDVKTLDGVKSHHHASCANQVTFWVETMCTCASDQMETFQLCFDSASWSWIRNLSWFLPSSNTSTLHLEARLQISEIKNNSSTSRCPRMVPSHCVCTRPPVQFGGWGDKVRMKNTIYAPVVTWTALV